MTTSCPRCGAPAQPDARFCDECGTRLVAEAAATAPARPPANLPPLLSLPNLEPLSLEPGQLGSELIVEVETNRPMVHGHALMLRFRVTSNLRSPCGVTLRMKLHGQGRYIEQEPGEIEQRCLLDGRGNQHIFSFPFHSLRPGDVVVQELRLSLTRPEKPGETIAYELPDRSLTVHVADPAMAQAGPGVVISGGIHIDFSKLEEIYGSDIKDVLRLNAQGAVEPGRPAMQWEPIRLHPVSAFRLVPELRLLLPGGVRLDLVPIQAGRFMMGSPEGQGKDDEWPVHLVRISRAFYLGKFPVTQEQYTAVMSVNPSRFPLSPPHPVDNISWLEAREFCRRVGLHVSQQTDRSSGAPVAIESIGLPTEAEWEFACRAGTQTLFSFGDEPRQMEEHGWFDKNSGRTTQAVGQKKPNAWNLYDMHGNVWEWCDDHYADDYSGATGGDPHGPASRDRRVMRGGSWSCYGKQCRSACRHAVEPSGRTANYGFRVVLRPKSRH
jgi:formylglycine-generating enzyme required for sulfatase activity